MTRDGVGRATAPAHAEGRQTESEVERPLAPATAQAAGQGRRHASLRRRERGADPSLSRPRLGEVGGGPACAGAGQAKKVAIMGSLDHVTRQLIVHTSATKRSSDSSPSGATRPSLWTAARATGQAGRPRSTTARSISARRRWRRSPSAPTGSPSNGWQNTPRNSTKSSRSGAILRPTPRPPDLHSRALDKPS